MAFSVQGKAGCWRKACFSSAAVRKDACRDVGWSLQEPQPEDFPGGRNQGKVCCVAVPSSDSFSHSRATWPGSDIRVKMGWKVMSKTEKSGVWFFQSAGGLCGRRVLPLLIWLWKGSYRTAWAVPCGSSCSCSYAYGRCPAVGSHTGGRCWPLLAGVWRAIALWGLRGVLCVWRMLVLLVLPLMFTGLGLRRCAYRWTRPLGGGRWEHSPREPRGVLWVAQKCARFFQGGSDPIGMVPYMLAFVGQPSLHGHYACMVCWVKGAFWRNCRHKLCKTSLSRFRFLTV